MSTITKTSELSEIREQIQIASDRRSEIQNPVKPIEGTHAEQARYIAQQAESNRLELTALELELTALRQAESDLVAAAQRDKLETEQKRLKARAQECDRQMAQAATRLNAASAELKQAIAHMRQVANEYAPDVSALNGGYTALLPHTMTGPQDWRRFLPEAILPIAEKATSGNSYSLFGELIDLSSQQ